MQTIISNKKVEDLINILNPDMIQCRMCGKYFSNSELSQSISKKLNMKFPKKNVLKICELCYAPLLK